jgi:hypothetical protein
VTAAGLKVRIFVVNVAATWLLWRAAALFAVDFWRLAVRNCWRSTRLIWGINARLVRPPP